MPDLPVNLTELTLTEICGLFDKAKLEKLDATNALEKSSKDVEALRKELVRRLAIPEGAPAKQTPLVTSAPTGDATGEVRGPGERRGRAEKAAAVASLKERIVAALTKTEWRSKESILQGTDATDWIAAITELKDSGVVVVRGERRLTEYRLK